MSETKQPRMPKVWEALIPVVAIMVFMIVEPYHGEWILIFRWYSHV